MTSREEFEKWHQEHIGDLLYRTGSGSYTGYLPISANNVYKAWQEASRRKQKIIDELEAENQKAINLIRLVINWNVKYPSSRIYGYERIRSIAKEMDVIFEQCKCFIEQIKESEG